MAVALHRLKGTQHRQGVGQALSSWVQADVAGHIACQGSQINGQKFHQIDSGDSSGVEVSQHQRRYGGYAHGTDSGAIQCGKPKLAL